MCCFKKKATLNPWPFGEFRAVCSWVLLVLGHHTAIYLHDCCNCFANVLLSAAFFLKQKTES